MTGRNRVRINQVGVADSLDANIARIHAEGDSVGVTQATEAFMKLDVVNFGRIVLALALRTVPTISRGGMLVSSMDTALDGLSRSNMYSNDFVQFVNLLVGSRFDITTLELLQHVAPRMAHEYANTWIHADALEKQLFKEMDASRLLRIATLIGFVNEREGGVLDPSWAETGDNYLLKLLRDYIYHQQDQLGRPVLDYGHVLECLHRLDMGTDEQVLLCGQDNNSLMVASYADLKWCLTQAIQELRKRAATAQDTTWSFHSMQ